jgi:hypothetical protein
MQRTKRFQIMLRTWIKQGEMTKSACLNNVSNHFTDTKTHPKSLFHQGLQGSMLIGKLDNQD